MRRRIDPVSIPASTKTCDRRDEAELPWYRQQLRDASGDADSRVPEEAGGYSRGLAHALSGSLVEVRERFW